jgi:hypothetical protein
MAVHKSDVQKKFSEEMASCLLAAESVIDKILQEKFSGGEVIIDLNVLTIPRPSDACFRERFKDEVIKRYEGFGWKVTAHSDQRDGSWFTFS